MLTLLALVVEGISTALLVGSTTDDITRRAECAVVVARLGSDDETRSCTGEHKAVCFFETGDEIMDCTGNCGWAEREVDVGRLVTTAGNMDCTVVVVAGRLGAADKISDCTAERTVDGGGLLDTIDGSVCVEAMTSCWTGSNKTERSSVVGGLLGVTCGGCKTSCEEHPTGSTTSDNGRADCAVADVVTGVCSAYEITGCGNVVVDGRTELLFALVGRGGLPDTAAGDAVCIGKITGDCIAGGVVDVVGRGRTTGTVTAGGTTKGRMAGFT